jgi:ABC-type cobalamin transport system permease subunit
MKHLFETIMLAVSGFIIFIGTVIYHIVAMAMRSTMMPLYNESGFGGKANPILDSIIVYGYIACLVFFVGAILLYLVESHEEEYETYEQRYR